MDVNNEGFFEPVEQEPWGACLSGRVFVGKLPEHVRKLAEDEGLTIQWLYTTPPQRTCENCGEFGTCCLHDAQNKENT